MSVRNVARAEHFRLRAQIIKAMAHPSRLMILEELAKGERCVCDLQRVVGADMSTVSKHLAVMRSAGIVRDRKVGLQVFYSLRVPCILRFLDCIEAVLDEQYAAYARSRPDLEQ